MTGSGRSKGYVVRYYLGCFSKFEENKIISHWDWVHWFVSIGSSTIDDNKFVEILNDVVSDWKTSLSSYDLSIELEVNLNRDVSVYPFIYAYYAATPARIAVSLSEFPRRLAPEDEKEVRKSVVHATNRVFDKILDRIDRWSRFIVKITVLGFTDIPSDIALAVYKHLNGLYNVDYWIDRDRMLDFLGSLAGDEKSAKSSVLFGTDRVYLYDLGDGRYLYIVKNKKLEGGALVTGSMAFWVTPHGLVGCDLVRYWDVVRGSLYEVLR